MAISIVSQPKPLLTPTVKLIKRQSLERVAKTDPAMVRSLLTMTANNLEHVENHMLLLGRQTAARTRGEAFLLEMNGRGIAGSVIALPMNRRDICGLSRPYLWKRVRVACSFLDFQRRGFLKLSREESLREIVVLNSAGLAELSR